MGLRLVVSVSPWAMGRHFLRALRHQPTTRRRAAVAIAEAAAPPPTTADRLRLSHPAVHLVRIFPCPCYLSFEPCAEPHHRLPLIVASEQPSKPYTPDLAADDIAQRNALVQCPCHRLTNGEPARCFSPPPSAPVRASYGSSQCRPVLPPTWNWNRNRGR
jgi:hypothetical protein